jgi:hypothetical protein
MVSRMSEPTNDPSSNTQAFQAWVDKQPEQRQQPEAKPTSKTPTIIVSVVIVLVILAALGWLAFG